MKYHFSKEVKRTMKGLPARRPRRIRINWKEVGSCVACILYGIVVVALFGLYLFIG